ncbi:MAG: hypothetical protein KDE33_19900 [Bacteroidetes bacterium]|nr:hypothetical protein [Bacteroidota bacterium]
MRILIFKFLPFWLILGLIMLFGFFGCNINTKNMGSSECQEFASLINDLWRFNDSTSTYYFKGNPEFWYDSKYFVEPCLMGKRKKEIIRMFGTPSKDFKFIDFEYLTYCMEESCLRTIKSEGKQIRFFFDSDGLVNQATISPPIQIRNFNH